MVPAPNHVVHKVGEGEQDYIFGMGGGGRTHSKGGAKLQQRGRGAGLTQ